MTPKPKVNEAALTGACACCGADTRSLFSMGHDARYRSALARALAAEGWDAKVAWFTSNTASEMVTVRQCLERINATLNRDWTQQLELQASRAASGRTRSKAPARARSNGDPAGAADGEPRRRSAVTSDFTPRNLAQERVDELLDRLDGHPLTGQWGWWRPANGDQRWPARVQETRRDSGDSRIDLFCPEAFKAGAITSVVVCNIEPVQWLRDEQARSGV